MRARFQGEARDYNTMWLTAGPRTLHFETYFMPQPEENHEVVHRYLMRWNRRLYLAAFSLDPDEEIFLSGRLPLAAVTAVEVDRVVGQLYQAVEQAFPSAIRLGFPRLFSR